MTNIMVESVVDMLHDQKIRRTSEIVQFTLNEVAKLVETSFANYSPPDAVYTPDLVVKNIKGLLCVD